MSDFFEEMLGSVDSLSEEQIQALMSRLNVKQSEYQGKNAIHKSDDDETAKVCIHCGSTAIKKHGFKSGKQRYFCKDCKKTFVISTGTISRYSRLTVAQWKELLRGLVENLSLQRIADNLDISTTSVWYNKQKVCTALLQVYDKQNNFVDIAECDEYYTTLS